uniref:Uncharacterized protein n=1 Tax=Magallana gigas TaxID=29159 RepID=A0A8W8IU72_MAGGI
MNNSLQQRWEQAFGIKNGDLSPVQTYSVKSGNTDCIGLHAGIEFIIPYTSNGARLTKTISVPNTTRVIEMCGVTTQSLSPMLCGDWILNFIFSHALSGSSPRRPLLLDDAITTRLLFERHVVVFQTRNCCLRQCTRPPSTQPQWGPATETVTDSPSPTPLPTDDDDHTGTIVGVVIPVRLLHSHDSRWNLYLQEKRKGVI